MPIVETLKQADIFYDLTPSMLDRLAGLCDERTYQMGDVIFNENSRGVELYVIAEGGVDILLNPAVIGQGEQAQAHTIARLRRGQSFGEVALVDEGLRSATAKSAQHNTRVLIIPRDLLMRMCEANPQMGYKLLRNLAADLAMKIRGADLAVREQIYYSPRRESPTE